VVDAAGQPVSDAVVYYSNVPQFSATDARFIGPVIRSRTGTDAAGRFSVSGLPFGRYLVCAAGTQPTQLRSCDWGLGIAVADLVQVTPSAIATLKLGDGCLIKITIEDPNGLVQDRPIDLPMRAITGNLSFGVISGGRYEPARLLSVVGAVRTYYVAVPKNTTFHLIMSTALAITNAAANALVQTASGDVRIDLGTVQ
jgi:hypothetical protein